MASEVALRGRVAKGLKGLAWVMQVETGLTSQGVPDTLAMFRLSSVAEQGMAQRLAHVWIEMKETAKPARASTVPFRGQIRPDQIQWLRWHWGLGGRCFLLLQCGTGLYLVPGSLAQEVNTRYTENDLFCMCVWSAQRVVPADEWRGFASRALHISTSWEPLPKSVHLADPMMLTKPE